MHRDIIDSITCNNKNIKKKIDEKMELTIVMVNGENSIFSNMEMRINEVVCCV